MTVDPRALAELLEESQDLQADALRPTHAALDELVDLSHSSEDGDVAANQAFHEENKRGLRASFAGASLLGAAGGAALVGVLASAAGAQSSQDVQVLQTAASIENLAVATYKTALTLPYIGGATANGVVTKFATGDHGPTPPARRCLQLGHQVARWQGPDQSRPGLCAGRQQGCQGPHRCQCRRRNARCRGPSPRTREHRRRDLRQGHDPWSARRRTRRSSPASWASRRNMWPSCSPSRPFSRPTRRS